MSFNFSKLLSHTEDYSKMYRKEETTITDMKQAEIQVRLDGMGGKLKKVSLAKIELLQENLILL